MKKKKTGSELWVRCEKCGSIEKWKDLKYNLLTQHAMCSNCHSTKLYPFEK